MLLIGVLKSKYGNSSSSGFLSLDLESCMRLKDEQLCYKCTFYANQTSNIC